MALRILFVVHDFIPDTVAGTEILVARLASALSSRADVAVFCTVRAPEQPQHHLLQGTMDGVDVFRMVQNYPYRALRDSLRDPGTEKVFAQVLARVQPDVVHFHHLAFLPLTLPALASSHGAATAFTLHDYFLDCPSGGRLTAHPDGRWCLSRPPPERCAACHARYRHREGGLEQVALALGGLPGLPPGWPFRVFRRLPGRVQQILRRVNLPAGFAAGGEPVREVIARRTMVQRLFDTVDLFIAPSRYMADWVHGIGLRGRLEVVPNPAPDGVTPSPLPPLPPVRIAFVGTPAPHKGLLSVVQAVSRFSLDDARLEVCGDMNLFPGYAAEVRRAAGPNVTFRGRCAPGVVLEVLSRAHLLALGSHWPENAPLTILEAHACGRPVVAPRAGGIPEYVRDGVDGMLFTPGRAGHLGERLERLISTPVEIFELAKGIAPSTDTVSYANTMLGLYRALLGTTFGGEHSLSSTHGGARDGG